MPWHSGNKFQFNLTNDYYSFLMQCQPLQKQTNKNKQATQRNPKPHKTYQSPQQNPHLSIKRTEKIYIVSKIGIQKLSVHIQTHIEIICMFLKTHSWAAQGLHTVFPVRFYFNCKSNWFTVKYLFIKYVCWTSGIKYINFLNFYLYFPCAAP